MHPQISKFISDQFYNSEITDANIIMDLIGKPSLYTHIAFQPFMFFNIKGLQIYFFLNNLSIKNGFKNQIEHHIDYISN